MPKDAVVMETSSEWTAALRGTAAIHRALGSNDRYPGLQRTMPAGARAGGDFYDFVPLPRNRLALAVGDASGKGLAAALMISNVQSSLRTAALFAEAMGPRCSGQ